MPCFLETDVREKILKSVVNTVNNPHQSKTFLFFSKQNFMLLFLGKYIFKNPENSIALTIFCLFVEADTKGERNVLAKASEANF